MTKYILKNKKPVIIDDAIEWAKWWENIENRRVAVDEIGNIKISTVFLGIDHNFGARGSPLLFETMIFKGNESIHQIRTATFKGALYAHKGAKEIMMNNTLSRKMMRLIKKFLG